MENTEKEMFDVIIRLTERLSAVCIALNWCIENKDECLGDEPEVLNRLQGILMQSSLDYPDAAESLWAGTQWGKSYE